MSKTKILVLSHSSEIGGAELSMLDFFEYWRKKEKNIALLFIIREPLDKLAPELKKRGFNYVSLAYTSWVMPQLINRPEDIFRNARINTGAVKEIEKIIHQFKPTIVMTNTIIAPWAAFAAKLNHLPHIWFIREYGDIDHRHSFEIGRDKTFEDIDILSDLVITNSQALSAHVCQYISKKKVATLYTPFNVTRIKSLYKKAVTDPFTKKADIKIIIVGAIRPSKGQELVIKAVGELYKKGIRAELCLVGHVIDPEYLPKLKRDINRLGIVNQIHFVGKQSNPYGFIQHADVGIMASGVEAFGRVTFEYLTLGIPVIGVSTGGTLEMVKDNVNGFLFTAGNVYEISQKIELYIKYPKLIFKHGRAAEIGARNMLKGQYGADAIIKKIRRVIQKPDSYQLPNFSRRWLDIPSTLDGMSYGSGVIHIAKKAINLGPIGTYHRARHKIGVKVNKYRKKQKNEY